MTQRHLLWRDGNGQIVQANGEPVGTRTENSFVLFETRFYNRVGRTGGYVLTGIEYVYDPVQTQNFNAKRMEFDALGIVTQSSIGWLGVERAHLASVLAQGPPFFSPSGIHLGNDLGWAMGHSYKPGDNNCIVMYQVLKGAPGVHSTVLADGIKVRSKSQLRPFVVINFRRAVNQPRIPPHPPRGNELSIDEARQMHEAAKTLVGIRNRH